MERKVLTAKELRDKFLGRCKNCEHLENYDGALYCGIDELSIYSVSKCSKFEDSEELSELFKNCEWHSFSCGCEYIGEGCCEGYYCYDSLTEIAYLYNLISSEQVKSLDYEIELDLDLLEFLDSLGYSSLSQW